MGESTGGRCHCCRKYLLVNIRGALVCFACDAVRSWPNGTDGREPEEA